MHHEFLEGEDGVVPDESGELEASAGSADKLMSDMVEKKLTLSNSSLEVLRSDKGLQKVKRELESNNVEAVFVIDKDARIIGTSGAHADNAVRHVNKLMLEEKVQVDDKSKHLLKTSEWRQLCDEINTGTDVRVHRNEWNDTYVAGFRYDVIDVMKKVSTFLETKRIREERFMCTSEIVRRYLADLREEDLRSIENQLKDFEVKIKKGKGDTDFDISGNREGLTRVRKKLYDLGKTTESKTFDVKQPGLRRYFESGKGDRLVKWVEKDTNCAIQVHKNFGQRQDQSVTQTVVENSSSSGSDDDIDDVNDIDEDEEEAALCGGVGSVLVMTQGQKISWRPGNIEKERADVLVCSLGASSQAIVNAGVPAVTTPNVGDITVSPGLPLANHVILANCCHWESGKGEGTLRAIVQKCLRKGEELGVRSIAFPVIGTGNLSFPPDAASRIMLEETASFCQTNAGSNVQDIRFVVYQQDHALTTAFKQEMDKLQAKHKSRPLVSRFFSSSGSKFRPRATEPAGRMSIKVLQGDLCEETMDAIVNINSKDQGVSSAFEKGFRFNVEVINGDLTQESTDAIMNINRTYMNIDNAGEVGNATANESGSEVQQECSQLERQTAGSAVMTSGGSLNVPHTIHIIPSSSDKQHLQQCLEEGLRLADTHNLRSISIPSVGTGGYGLAAVDSAQVIFQALRNFSSSCKSICKVRVVVFKAEMLQDFLEEQKRQPMQDVKEEDESEGSLLSLAVIGKSKEIVEKAVESLKQGFFEACPTEKVENEVISQLSQKQINSLRRKAEDHDVRLEVEAAVNRIAVRGQLTEVSRMVGEIWKQISKRMKKKQEEEQALLVSKNIEWSYEIHANKKLFGPKANAKIEMAYSKDEATVQVSLRADQFVVDLKAKTGQGQKNGEQITLSRKVKGAEEGIALPQHWTPMPRPDTTVHLVPLSQSSSEYQDVVRKFQATSGGINILKIERIQNPHLYKSYMVRKQKMDKDTGRNSERQLFHGTAANNITLINAQGFNRSFCGANGVVYGRGVYFARDASYSLGYARGGPGGRHMYLARVLVGQYCAGNSAMIVPPAKNASRPEILYESVVDNPGNPSIFVVFYDTQCYPEYLITMQ